ncbi:MAG: hypothetical protein ACI9PZ_003128 [Parvicella sp.]|jgi:hypothetical protein
MSFVKTYEEIIENHSESADFSNAEMISVVWETTPESIEKLLPSPLKPADSYVYQIRSGITDDEMLEQCRSMINKFDLEKNGIPALASFLQAKRYSISIKTMLITPIAEKRLFTSRPYIKVIRKIKTCFQNHRILIS